MYPTRQQLVKIAADCIQKPADSMLSEHSGFLSAAISKVRMQLI